MSDATEAWEKWNEPNHGLNMYVYEFGRSAFLAGFAAGQVAALEDAADEWQQGQWADALSGTQRPTQVQARIATAQAVTDWLRSLAEAHARPAVDIPDCDRATELSMEQHDQLDAQFPN